MRSLLLLTVLTVVLLAIDTAKFHGQYRKAVWHEANSQYGILQDKAQRYSVGWF
jgi:hypothetical protein